MYPGRITQMSWQTLDSKTGARDTTRGRSPLVQITKGRERLLVYVCIAVVPLGHTCAFQIASVCGQDMRH